MTEAAMSPATRDKVRAAPERPIGLVRGTRDWLPDDYEALVALERRLLDAFARGGYRPMRTPILEYTELHERKSGAGIVSSCSRFPAAGRVGFACVPN